MYKPHQLYLGIFIFSTIVFIFLAISPIRTYAGELSGSGYIIKMGTINIVSGNISGPNIKMNVSVGQTTQGEFETTGYRIKSGFQYNQSKEPFAFSINTDSVNLGSLIANTFGSSSATLTINGVGVRGYTLKAIENHALQIGDTPANIPDTICDPNEKCTPSNATPWTSTTAYGLGYSLQGDDVDQEDFVDTTYFRPFANNALNQNPATLMSRASFSKKSVATITLRANISPTQNNGLYENSIQFIAIPSY